MVDYLYYLGEYWPIILVVIIFVIAKIRQKYKKPKQEKKFDDSMFGAIHNPHGNFEDISHEVVYLQDNINNINQRLHSTEKEYNHAAELMKQQYNTEMKRLKDELYQMQNKLSIKKQELNMVKDYMAFKEKFD